MDAATAFAVRSSFGINVNWGPPKFSENEGFGAISSKSCRIMLFSPFGDYFAYVVGINLHIVKTQTWENTAIIEGTKSYNLKFSPKGTYLCSWEPFNTPKSMPNLNVYKSENGDIVRSCVNKKQSNWEPFWSADEKVFSCMGNSDIAFYEEGNYNTVMHRLNGLKIISYSFSQTIGSYFVATHIQGGQGQPSFGRLFKYPNFEDKQGLVNRSFFQADKVDFYWNNKGTHVLLLTYTEMDKTGGSYYGKQGLHFIGVNGDSMLVTLSKGPIYSVAWSPKNQEFCAIYGFMPAKATIFNLKCEPVYEFEAAPRNSIYYNLQGNILLLAGFGNLRGHVEVWDIDSKKLIGSCEAPDSTLLQWAPDGIHFLTATTSPRLRTGNGYKIWHYSGSLMHEFPCKEREELYDVSWQNTEESVFKDPVLSNEKVKGIVSSQPQASKEVYRPPSARNRPSVHFKEEFKTSTNEAAPSKATLKLKKKRQNRKAKKQETDEELAQPSCSAVTSNVHVILSGDPEKDKKIRNIKKKLDAIAKLKDQQAQGRTLEINQMAKIKGEEELLIELKQLQL